MAIKQTAPDDAVSTPSASQASGIDVSHYQGDIDWMKVKASGQSFVFVKATESNDMVDDRFAANWSGAKTAGLLRGAYHFYRFDASPKSQADLFLATVDGDLGELPLVVDVEDVNVAKPNISDVKQFLDIVQQRTGQRCIIFTARWYWSSQRLEKPVAWAGNYDLWLADYGTPRPIQPDDWSTWKFWQHNNSTKVDGISSPVDLNYFQGTITDLQLYSATHSSVRAKTAEQVAETTDTTSAKAPPAEKQASASETAATAQQPLAPTPPVEQIDQVDSRALADVWSKEDYLGFKEYAKALADFIRNPKTGKPLTISIDAPWGMGKTTLMHLVEEELKETQAVKPGKQPSAKPGQAPAPAEDAREKVEVFPTVWFNAWKYDQEESLWAAFVLEILGQVRRKPYFGLRRRIKLWAKLNWKRLDKGALLQRVLKSVGMVLGLSLLGGLLYLAAVLLFQLDPQRPPLQLLADYIGTVGILGFVGALYAAGKEAYETLSGPFDLKIADYIREPNYQERVGFLGEFEADYERVIAAITDETHPLIVFIDDLDRCAPPKPTEIIEAINILLSAEHCVFILGMDARAVAASIEAKYKDLEEYLVDNEPGEDLPLGYHFLEKIVQFNFRVPRADQKMITPFIRASLGAAERPAAPAPTTAEVAEAKDQIQVKMKFEKKPETQAYGEVLQDAEQSGSASAVAAAQEARQQVFAISFDDSDEVEQAVQKVAPYFEFNPRKIKRFINYYRLQALIAKRLNLLDDKTIHLDLLATWLLITMRWPGVLEELSDNEELIGQLKQAHEVCQYLKQADRDPKVIQDYEASLPPHVKAWSEDAALIKLLGEITQQSAGAWSTYFDLTQMTSGSHALAAPTPQLAK
jgi:GH25 family lysozyme M1 (1,4-beta-N-acetylmuramidase)